MRGSNDGKDSNFYQLILLHSENSAGILDRAGFKYTSPDVQHEILSIMALKVLCEIVCQLQSSVYTVMINKTTDISNTDQVVVVFHWVDNALSVHEEFVGLYQTKCTDAGALAHVIKDTLLRFNLKLNLCHRQCYDGASAMSGTRSAVYTHCFGHALNLAVNDTIRQSPIMKSALDTVNEVSKLIKKSPKRDAIFHDVKTELAPETAGFCVLCPMRWTVRALTLQTIKF